MSCYDPDYWKFSNEDGKLDRSESIHQTRSDVPSGRPVRCSYPGCERMTTYDPVYEDLCPLHIRADNE